MVITMSPFCKFQSTFPHGERRPSTTKRKTLRKGFNPRSRTGNDRDNQGNHSYISVSIHVPARGTTMALSMSVSSSYAVSIHVPARGTTNHICEHVLLILFQSTFPHGERQGWDLLSVHKAKFQSTFPHGERRGLPARLRE